MTSIDRLWRKVRGNLGDFNAWISLLEAVEKQQDIEVSRKAFDSFLEHFPYCYGYWKKYAELERYAGDKERCLEIYAKGVSAIPLSIDLWTAYLDATMEVYHGKENYESRMRSLYELSLETAGLEFRSDALWEHYISWESGHNRLKRVLLIYDRLLKTPTQLYYQNWDSFKKLIEDNRPEDVLPTEEFCLLLARFSPVAATAIRISLTTGSDSGSQASKKIPEITEADRTAIRQCVIELREKVYQATYMQIMKRWYFEEKIRRPYFHVKPLEEAQLNNWAEYLSFEESEAETARKSEETRMKTATVNETATEFPDSSIATKRVRVLYERCLVACALYEHVWIRYAKYLEHVEKDIPAAREVWRRATRVHLREKPSIHWHWALFEERHPAQLDETQEVNPIQPLTCLEIFTQLEQRLPDSALVCARRLDAMRRARKPLIDMMICARSGINRLRLRAMEQANLASSVSGPAASMSSAIALATSAQARAGASFLAAKVARLLHRNVNSLVPLAGIPTWQLLLNAAYKTNSIVEDDKENKQADVELKQEEEEEVEEEKTNKKKEDKKNEGNAEKVRDEATPTKLEDDRDEDEDASMMEGVSDEDDGNENEVTPETLASNTAAATSSDDIEMDTTGSPPVVLVRTTKSASNSVEEPCGENKREAPAVEEEEQPKPVKRRRRTRWETAEEQRAIEEEEKQAEVDAKEYAEERRSITTIEIPPTESLTEEDKALLTSEEAAIAVLNEAIEYDPRNERLYSQLLDIAYQRRPLDLKGFIDFVDLAIVDSLLPATIKLAFCQRKLQFLEEFGNDINQLRTAHDEYIALAKLVCQYTNNKQTGVDATQAYSTPDLLNVVLPAPLRPTASHNPAPNGPVRKMPRLATDRAVLEDAASVGTPIPPPVSAVEYFSAGAYEHLAGAQAGIIDSSATATTSGLPPAAPLMVPVSTPLNGATVPPAVAAAAAYVSSAYGPALATGGAYYVPLAVATASAAGDSADFSVPAPPPAPPLTLGNLAP